MALKPTPTLGAAVKRFPFAAGAGLAICGARPFDADPRIALDHRGTNSAAAARHPDARRRAAHPPLDALFRLVYGIEGVGQVDGLIAQPLSFYLKEVHGWTPLQVSAYLTIFNFPWIIKPIYGALSDFVPLFGYRRKLYSSLAANMSRPAPILWATQLTAPEPAAVRRWSSRPTPWR